MVWEAVISYTLHEEEGFLGLQYQPAQVGVAVCLPVAALCACVRVCVREGGVFDSKILANTVSFPDPQYTKLSNTNPSLSEN